MRRATAAVLAGLLGSGCVGDDTAGVADAAVEAGVDGTTGDPPDERARPDVASGDDAAAPSPDADPLTTDAAPADARLPDAEAPLSDLPDARPLDADVPDADLSDADLPDADLPDADAPDADLPDAATPDADVPDAALVPPLPVPCEDEAPLASCDQVARLEAALRIRCPIEPWPVERLTVFGPEDLEPRPARCADGFGSEANVDYAFECDAGGRLLSVRGFDDVTGDRVEWTWGYDAEGRPIAERWFHESVLDAGHDRTCSRSGDTVVETSDASFDEARGPEDQTRCHEQSVTLDDGGRPLVRRSNRGAACPAFAERSTLTATRALGPDGAVTAYEEVVLDDVDDLCSRVRVELCEPGVCESARLAVDERGPGCP